MTICVHGIGYIGLATAALFANNGHEVVGYDPDAEKIERLRQRDPRTEERELREYVVAALDRGFVPSDEPREADYHLICVPTPYDPTSGSADLRYVEQAGRTVAERLRPGDTVILESTVPPGTTATVLGPLLEESGLRAGEEFHLAHCPETVLPGNIVHELRHNDRIVGGVDDDSTEAARALFGPVTEGAVRRAPDATTAEFVKLVQNAYRDVNIGFANELARVARGFDIDVRDAIGLANYHPRVDILRPGPGVGGHCLPIDPLFLDDGPVKTDLIAAARRVNDGMSRFVVELLKEELGTLDGRTVAVLGVAYKGNVDDTRNSPGLRLLRELRQPSTTDPQAAITATDGGHAVVDTRLHDPHVEDEDLDLLSLEAALHGADAAVVATDHDEFADIDPETARDLMAGHLVVDAKAVLDDEAWADAGFRYVRV